MTTAETALTWDVLTVKRHGLSGDLRTAIQRTPDPLTG